MKPTVIEDYNATMDGMDKAVALQHSVCCFQKAMFATKN